MECVGLRYAVAGDLSRIDYLGYERRNYTLHACPFLEVSIPLSLRTESPIAAPERQARIRASLGASLTQAFLPGDLWSCFGAGTSEQAHGTRRKPWNTLFASAYDPVITPAGLITEGIVPCPGPVPAPGTLNSLIAPSRARTQPW